VRVRAVCLSDLHFGAENSLLSRVTDDAVIDPDTPSPVLTTFVDCLRALLVDQQGDRLPTLILNGDVLELALAQDNVAAMVFDRFVDLAFGTEAIFDPTVLYVPGNHDHHVWETARERMYAGYVRSTSPDSELKPPWHATNMFVEDMHHSSESELLSALMQRRAGSELKVVIVYPNLGLGAADSTRLAVVHHGHFTEPLYRLMSEGKAQLFPKQMRGLDVWDWEADNFAWIDFFWSTLGRSGTAGEDVGVIYDMLGDPLALDKLAGELGELAGKVGPGATRPLLRSMGRHGARWATKALLPRIERMNPSELLSESARKGLNEYVSGPVGRQLDHEGRPRSSCSFVFGHTHKPFESTQNFAGFETPVEVFNSGGWVVDKEKPVPIHGASVLLVDEDCRVSALRMFNQSANATDYRVEIRPRPIGEATELDAWIAGRFDFGSPPWSEFSRVVADEVSLRCRLLPKIIERGLSYTR
jgi:hypothetical protein